MKKILILLVSVLWFGCKKEDPAPPQPPKPPGGLLLQETYSTPTGTAFITKYTYDENFRLTRIDWPANGYRYQLLKYNAEGKVATIHNYGRNGQAESTENYFYNAAGQVSKRERYDFNASSPKYSYCYDMLLYKPNGQLEVINSYCDSELQGYSSYFYYKRFVAIDHFPKGQASVRYEYDLDSLQTPYSQINGYRAIAHIGIANNMLGSWIRRPDGFKQNEKEYTYQFNAAGLPTAQTILNKTDSTTYKVTYMYTSW